MQYILSRDTVVSRDEFTILYMYSVARPDRVSLREPASCEHPWLPNLNNGWTDEVL